MPIVSRCFKLTDEDWYPSWKLDGFHRGKSGRLLLEVSLIYYEVLSITARVCVWGADDAGMERDWTTPEGPSEAREVFFQVISMVRVSRVELEKLGFVRA